MERLKRLLVLHIILGGEQIYLMYHKQKYYKMETKLTIDQILDYCDVPQLFTARDTFDTLYLCLLYEDNPICSYTAIRLSSKRLTEFLSGKLDLRFLFVHPELDQEYFDVVFQNNEYQMGTMLKQTLPEERLPAEGYYMVSNSRENVVVNIPMNDRNLLKELVRKFGWACM